MTQPELAKTFRTMLDFDWLTEGQRYYLNYVYYSNYYRSCYIYYYYYYRYRQLLLCKVDLKTTRRERKERQRVL